MEALDTLFITESLSMYPIPSADVSLGLARSPEDKHTTNQSSVAAVFDRCHLHILIRHAEGGRGIYFNPRDVNMSTPILPVYFELSWSILSTIGAANVLFGLLIVGITNLSQVTVVPIVSSAAGAIANGLCFYAFYDEQYSLDSKAVASAFGDFFWMVQEVGLSFYSYVLLQRILKDTEWKVFNSLFWITVLSIVSIRIMIAVSRVRYILKGNTNLQNTVNNLHIGYFALLASLECLGAFFLLKTFAEVQSTSTRASLKGGLFKYLMRSTEVRLATLAMLGTMRAVTYSFQRTAQSATNAASQLDRFAYTLECLFPVVMFIDVLASKLVFKTQMYDPTRPSCPALRKFASAKPTDWYAAMQQSESLVEIQVVDE